MKTIGCDIGGVLKDLATGEPVEGALEGMAKLATHDARVVLICKCGQSFKESSLAWLAAHGLASTQVHFCEADDGKVHIAKQQGVAVMIDDRIQVLRTFPDSVVKVWLCADEKKIAGTIKHQPELFATFRLARTWEEVVDIAQAP